MTVEAHPLPFKHQDNTLFAAPACRRRFSRRATRGRLVAVRRAPKTNRHQCLYFTRIPFFSCTIDFFKGEIR